ncbi:condensation domain-containing protein, partial [Roseateles sp. DB2]|uniref:condensation domain-containing protein n=1 Tax=Roseateles sp. DB2 TaxID=3453717 RepID=UPI003EEC0DC0
EAQDPLQEEARLVLPPLQADPSRGASAPLTHAQQRLWFLTRLPGVSQAYHIHLALKLQGQLKVEALRSALQQLIDRHEALRTGFSQEDGQPLQRIAAQAVLPWREAEVAADAVIEAVQAEVQRPFDLQQPPLLRAALLHEPQQAGDDKTQVLVLTLHHLVADGWSIDVLWQELQAQYTAALSQPPRSAELAPLPLQYGDYAAWQRRWMQGDALSAQARYWLRTLGDAPQRLELPTDRPRPAEQSLQGARVALHLDEALSAQLKAYSQRHGVTLFMLLLGAWGVLLSRWSGQAEVVIGTPVANRSRRELEGLIGLFVNTLALRLPQAGEQPAHRWLQQLRQHVLQAQRHQDLPFEQVVELLRPERSLAYTPLFQVMFAWQGTVAEGWQLPGLRLQGLGTPHAIAKFDLTLELMEAQGCIVGHLEYATA